MTQATRPPGVASEAPRAAGRDQPKEPAAAQEVAARGGDRVERSGPGPHVAGVSHQDVGRRQLLPEGSHDGGGMDGAGLGSRGECLDPLVPLPDPAFHPGGPLAP